VSFEAVRRDAVAAAPMPEEGARSVWKNGLDTFFFKGTNGRWRDVLTPHELAMYERAKARCLEPACAAWLEAGRAAWTAPAAERRRA
jgi:aryl sulfotransferase